MNFLQNNLCADSDVSRKRSGRRIVRGLLRGNSTLLPVVSMLLLFGHSSSAQAQVSFGNFGNFGGHSASEGFFEAGRDSFEQEIRRLQAYSDSSQPLLSTSGVDQIRQDILRLENPAIPAEQPPSSQQYRHPTEQQGDPQTAPTR